MLFQILRWHRVQNSSADDVSFLVDRLKWAVILPLQIPIWDVQ